ncbi:hypothetical protein [Mycoplasma sp. 327]
MKKTNRRKKVVAGIITGVSIGATIGTGYVLLNETIKWNHTMAKLQALIKKMNEWKKQNEINKKTYTHDLYATFEKELNELDQLLNIKDIKKVDEILTKLQSSKINFKNYKSQYDNLELLNGEAISEKSSFSDLLANYESKYNNKPFATKYIAIYNQEKTNLENQYNNATNEDGLAKVKAKAIELKNNLQVLFNLTDEILNAKNIDSKFPSDIKNKGIFEKAIKEAEKILNNPNATLEERQKALNSLHEKISEFQKTLSLEKQNLIKQINDLVKDAENYKNTTLDYDKYKNLAKKLDTEITNIKNKMSKDNEIATLRDILEKAKPLKSDAQQIKEAIDGLIQELPSSQKLLKEIESASDLFSSQKIEDELKDAINVGNEALKKLDKNSITEALANLNNKSEQASDLIAKQKDKLISEITGLIEKGHQQLDKIKSSDEYENNRDQISDAIEKAQRSNNTNTLLGDLVTNKNILDSLLTKTKKQVARDNLTREIAIAKQNLKYTKENNIISPTNEFEKFIQDAEKTLETLDNEQKSVDEIEVEYNNGAKTLKDSYLQKSKEASISALVEAKELNTELEQEKFKDKGTYHVSKKDLQSRINSAEETNSNANSNSYNILEKLNELNKAIKEAKRFRDADENERKKIIEEIIKLKEDIISKKDELIGAQNGLKNENSEKYKTLIKELDKVLEDYNTNIEPNVSDFGVARLDDVKVNLKKIIDKIPKEKEEINKKFSELNTKLDELVKKANDFVSQMPTDEYNPEKQDLKDLITKTQDPTNRDAIDELKQLVEDFKDKNRKAETKIIQINSNKDEEIEKINNKIAEITDFANANKDEYPQITTPLLESLKLVKDNNYPSYNNTIQELQQKLSNITSALDNAKQLLSNTQNKEQLSLSTNQLEAIKDSIKSNDDEMMQLKHNLDVEIQKAREIIAKEQTDKYTQEKQTIDNLKQSAEQQIIDFEQKLTEAKSRFNQAKESANSVLEQAKSDPNSANYADIITKIKEKISQNDVIDENGPLKNIDAATAELNGLASFYNAEKEKADAITQAALDKLNQEIENAEQIKNTMEQEPDLDTQKAVLEKAIEVARTSHMQNTKLTNNAIKQAQDTLKQAEDVANDAINKANKQKDGIRTNIAQKEVEIQNYINNVLIKPEYEAIKNDLDAFLKSYEANDKNLLGQKTRQQLDDLLTQMNMHLDSAKQKKDEKDAEIRAKNKQALAEAKEALANVSNSITSKDPKMTALRDELNQAISESEAIITNEESDKYVSQKEKLENLSKKAETTKTDFAKELQKTKEAHAQKILDVRNKISQLQADENAANLNDVIQKLQQAITNNQITDDNQPLADINHKKDTLQKAIETAENEKIIANKETEAALDNLGKTINEANSLASSMQSEPLLNDAKNKLEQTIEEATAKKNHGPKKLTNAEINNANKKLSQAKQEAENTINSINKQKSEIRTQINQKAKDIKDYADTLTKSEYKDIKDKLTKAVSDFETQNKKELNNKTKQQLDEILNDLSSKLTEAKAEQAKKDGDIKEFNKQQLLNSKDALNNFSSTITSNDSEMIKLKEDIKKAIDETDKIIKSSQSEKYEEQKKKLDNLKITAEQQKKQFDAKIQEAKSEHDKKIREANDKLTDLRNDVNSNNLTEVITKLQEEISNNQSSSITDSIQSINSKKEALQHAIQIAEAEKAEVDKKINKDLDDFEKTLEKANATKNAMNNEPELNNQKQTLEQAINNANNIKNAHKKALDSQIKEANKILAEAERVAKAALDNINNQKSELIKQIQIKADEIQQYKNQNLSNDSAYGQIKNELETILNNYNNNDKTNINSKTKHDLEQIKSKLDAALEKAKRNKAQKDAEIAETNKRQLTKAKNDLQGVANRIITRDPEMTKLKEKLNSAISEAINVLNREEHEKFIEQKNKLNNLKNEANSAITNFNNRLHTEQDLHKKKLRDAQAKLDSLKQDSNHANLATIINQLQQIINTNKSIKNTDPIESISDKASALEQATTNAETQRAAANQKTDAEIAKLEMILEKANATKAEMAKEPALSDSTTALSNAINLAQPAANKTAKLTDAQITDANRRLTAAEDVAKKALDAINKQKETLRAQTQQKADAIKDYINSILNKNEYKKIKQELQKILDTYNSQNKPNLLTKTKAQLEEISKNLEDQLNKAKQKKEKQDSDTSIANKKKEINELIDKIPYPDPKSREATQAKNALKNTVNQLNNIQSLDQKQTEITKFSSHMQTKKNQLSANDGNLKYSENNAQAVQKIKQKLNSAQNINQANNALPDGWANKIETYKNVINSSFNDGPDKNNLITRLNQTVPTTITGNDIYNENHLKNEIIQNYKRLAKDKIGTLSNIPQNNKNNIKSNIDNIQVPSDHTNLSKTINDIKSLVTNATRQNFNLFINKLAYPEDTSQLRTDSLNTKEKIKQALTSKIDYSNKNSVETTLNILKTNIDALKKEIDKIKPEAKKNEFLTEFSKADHTKISTLLQKVRKYKQDYKNKKRLAQEVISQITDQNKKKKLQEKLDNPTNSIENFDAIKTEAENQKEKEIKQKSKELQRSKDEAKKIVDEINFPSGNKSHANETLKHQIDQAQSIDEINRLNENNKKIKDAVKRALEAIDKLTDNNEKENLKRELDSTISIDGQNSGIKHITGKAIMKHREALEKKKGNIQKEIEKQKNSADKKDLINQLKHIESEKDLDMVKQQLNLIKEKDKLKDEVSKLVLFDLSKHPNKNGQTGRGGLNSSQLSMLNKRISDATTDHELQTIKVDIERQKQAELNDLKLQRANGGFETNLYTGESTFNDYSEMKKSLFSIISNIKIIKGLQNSGAQQQFFNNGTQLQNKILYQTNTLEEYKRVKQEVENFTKRWEDDSKTKNWTFFFIERVEKHSTQSPPEAGPFPVNVASEHINHIKSIFAKQETTREQAIKAENDYLKHIFFNARRLKKLDYDYLQFIKDLKLNPFLDENEKSRLDAQFDKFKKAPDINSKAIVALDIDPSLIGKRTNTRDFWRSSSQIDFVEYWVSMVAEASENVISQENKYIWIDKIALTIDERKEVAKKLWNEFKAKYKDTLLKDVLLDKDGFPQRHAPFFE